MHLFFIIIVLGCVAVCLGVQQQFGFHTELGCKGDALILQSKQPDVVPEAHRIFSNHKSVSYTGFWKAYDALNYATPWRVFAGEQSTTCVNYSSLAIQSIRYLGPPDTTTDSISLYQERHFRGQEITVTGPAIICLPFEVKSIFSTGQTRWTLYTGNNFDGNATCFIPREFVWYDFRDYVISNIGSISRGCNIRQDQYLHYSNEMAQ